MWLRLLDFYQCNNLLESGTKQTQSNLKLPTESLIPQNFILDSSWPFFILALKKMFFPKSSPFPTFFSKLFIHSEKDKKMFFFSPSTFPKKTLNVVLADSYFSLFYPKVNHFCSAIEHLI